MYAVFRIRVYPKEYQVKTIKRISLEMKLVEKQTLRYVCVWLGMQDIGAPLHQHLLPVEIIYHYYCYDRKSLLLAREDYKNK